jgi:hypothetical protein
MLAAVAGKEDMGVMLAKRFPESIASQNASGLDAVCCSPLSPPSHCLTSTHSNHTNISHS